MNILISSLVFIFCATGFSQIDVLQIQPPDAFAFEGWREQPGYATGVFNSAELTQKSISPQCNLEDKKLYPTHPQQFSKIYHLYEYGNYNSGKLIADSEACTLPSKFKNPAGEYRCIKADTAQRVVMSDLFRDRCGNIYRAYWFLLFLSKNESMGTLSSLGRSIYPKPNSEFEGEYVDGDTYLLETSQFLFLIAADADDVSSAKKWSTEALKGSHSFDNNSLLFRNKAY